MSLLTDLFTNFAGLRTDHMASALGESEESVSKGTRSAIAAILGGLANKSGNPEMLQKMLDMVPAGVRERAPSDLTGAFGDPSVPILSTGKRLLWEIFGESQSMITQALGSDSGLSHGSTSIMMSMVAPMVINFLRKRVQSDGMNMAELASLLQREAPSIRVVLPGQAADLLGAGLARQAATALPVATPTAATGGSSRRWLVPVMIIGAASAMWLFMHGHKPAVGPEGSANRTITGERTSLPDMPDYLLLRFQPDSITLAPEAEAQLKDFATAVASRPDIQLAVNAYTDNTGSADRNIQISQKRADAVKDVLVRGGVSADRITATGMGAQNPIADNKTALGREANNRVSVKVSGR